MIPKIAHFHWTATPMSWMRMATIATFKRHNPGWEIRLHDTPADIRKHGLLPAHEGDWTRWRVLEEFGGFSVGSDIVFVKPVPDAWLDCGLNACTNGSRGIFQMAMVGAVPEHPFIGIAADRCAAIPKFGKIGYQDFGPNLLQEMGRELFEVSGKFLDQPMDALCHFRHTTVNALWGDYELWGFMDFELPESAIGIHWYGGHPISKLEEPNAGPGGDPYIVRLAEKEWA